MHLNNNTVMDKSYSCLWLLMSRNLIQAELWNKALSFYSLTHCLPRGSFSCIFSNTLTSSFAASRYLSTFLMIFNASTLSLKWKSYNWDRVIITENKWATEKTQPLEHLTANISLLAFGIIDICLLLKLQNANCVFEWHWT